MKKTRKKRNTPAGEPHAIDCDMGGDCTCKWASDPLKALTPDARDLVLLEDLFRLSRRYGVLEWDGNVPGSNRVVKFKLASALASDPDPVAPSKPPEAAAQPAEPVKGPKKLGADGLTAEMQDELLGRVMDAER